MLFLVSPAKALDYGTPAPTTAHSQPLFVDLAQELVAKLQKKSVPQLAQWMELSDKLAQLNRARYQAWSPQFTAQNSKQALFAFNGDVYEGLQAASLTPAQLTWAQEHVCILSGLYGVLRPLDWMQPYRLEMGTTFETTRGKNLYQFWAGVITPYLNARLQADPSPVVVNLASQEYFKAVDLQALQPRVVHCVFEEFKNGQYKIISFMAKRARGLMLRYAIEKKCRKPESLAKFDAEGYAFAASVSTPERMVFRR